MTVGNLKAGKERLNIGHFDVADEWVGFVSIFGLAAVRTLVLVLTGM